MSIYKNLTFVLTILAVASLICIIVMLQPFLSFLHPSFVSAPVSVFALAVVGLGAAIVLYFNARSSYIKTLKRRGGRAYGELLQYKMKLIDVLDGHKPFVDSEKYLYSEDAFQRIKKFLYEEFFLLLQFEPFLPNTSAAKCVMSFYSLHKELEVFMRSVNYDKIDFEKFKVLYQKTFNQPITSRTAESNFEAPELKEAFDAITSAREYALTNTDHLLTFLDEHLTELDKFYSDGVPWKVTKSSHDSDFQLWMYSNS